MRRWFIATTLTAGLLTGASCAHSRVTQYSAGWPLPAPVTLKRGGDFALYCEANGKPEIPIRLHAGDVIGFERAKDGRVQAVAGEFRMNLSGEASSAYWKRLNMRDD